MSVSLADKDAFVMAVLADTTLSLSAKAAAVALAVGFLNRNTLRCDPSYEALGLAIGLKRRATILAVQELEKAGWIKLDRRGGRRRPNLFALRFDRLERVHTHAPFGAETVHGRAPFEGEKVHDRAPISPEKVHAYAPEPPRPSDVGERVPARAPCGRGGNGFEAFWQAYPKRTGQLKAEAIFQDLVASGRATPEALIAGATRYAAERAGEEARFTKSATSWLEGGHWLDEPAQPRAPGAGKDRSAPFSFMDYARQTAGRSNR